MTGDQFLLVVLGFGIGWLCQLAIGAARRRKMIFDLRVAKGKAIYFEFIAREQCAKCAARRRCGFGFLAKRNEDRIN